MAEKDNLIRLNILKFYNLIKNIYPVKKILIYGSHAKGLAHKDSDIDVAVIVDVKEHKKRIEITSTLFHYANLIDCNIEPKCIFWDEYHDYDKASILAEIIRTGKEITLH